METWKHGHENTETWKQGHGDMETSNGKRKTEAQAISLNHLPFAHRADGSLSFVRLLKKK
jgi:hypothetical protein